MVLVGDPEQLQAIEAGAAFRSLSEQVAHAEIGEIRRQRETWQREATRHLATGRTVAALDVYRAHGMVRISASRDGARENLIEGWAKERGRLPEKSRLILAHTNDDVKVLNRLARARLREAGELGDDVSVQTERGRRSFATGDRVMFLKNERGLGVKNGSLGVVEAVSAEAMRVQLDGGRTIAFELKDYAHLDHGYAATIHKSQGVTVDRVHVLATPGLDRHGAYVALSRHRERIALHYGRDDFADDARLVRALSRERVKDMASDYVPQIGAGPQGRAVDPTSAASRNAGREQGIFAGFRPRSRPIELENIMPGNAPKPPSDLSNAVRRYASATADIARMQERSLPVLVHQREALHCAGSELEKIRPHGAEDLVSAFAQAPELVREAAAGRTRSAVTSLMAATESRVALRQRTDRFIAGWQGLQAERARFEQAHNWTAAGAVRARMDAMAKGLARDPQIETALRGRQNELGIGWPVGRSLVDDLMEQLDRGLGRRRGRELGIQV